MNKFAISSRLRKKIILIFAVSFSVFILSGCSSTEKNYNSFEDLQACSNPVIGFDPDLDYTKEIESLLPGASIKYYAVNNGYEALRQGKLDAYLQTKSSFYGRVHNGLTGVKMLDEPVVASHDIAIPYSDSCDIPDLGEKINDFIAQVKADGTLDDLYQRWTVEYDTAMPDIPHAENPQYILTVGTNGENAPYCYLDNGQITGAEIELAYRLGAYLNAKVVFEVADYSGLIAGIASGRYDVLIANVFVTEEREGSVTYSDPYYCEEIHFLVRDESADGGSGLLQSLQRTLVEQNRWKTILAGLEITLLITVFGFPVCQNSCQ